MDINIANPIVFGFDSFNTAGSIRCLGEVGYKPMLIVVSTKKTTAVQKSKYISSSVRVSCVDEGIKILIKIAQDKVCRYLFATSDKVAAVLDQHYNQLHKCFLFPNCGSQGRLSKIMNKDTMSEIASRNGLRIPVTFDLKQLESFEFNKPIIIKPKESVTGSKRDIKIISTKQDWEGYSERHNKLENFIAQQYINKECECLIIGCRCSSKNVYFPAHFIKNRWVANGDAGAFGVLKRGIPNGLDIASMEMFLNDINYVGPFSLEFGENDGKFYFFEINLRNDGTINYFTKIGVNIPEIWIKDKLIIDYTKPSLGVYIDEFGDILNVIRGDLKIKRWLADFRKATIFKYYDEFDKGPFFVFAPKMIRVIISTIYRKITGRL